MAIATAYAHPLRLPCLPLASRRQQRATSRAAPLRLQRRSLFGRQVAPGAAAPSGSLHGWKQSGRHSLGQRLPLCCHFLKKKLFVLFFFFLIIKKVRVCLVLVAYCKRNRNTSSGGWNCSKICSGTCPNKFGGPEVKLSISVVPSAPFQSLSKMSVSLFSGSECTP